MKSIKRTVATLFAAVVAIGWGLAGSQISAQADGPSADEYIIAASVNADGSIAVQETIKFTQSAPSQVVQRFALTEDAADYTIYRYVLGDASVAAKATGGTFDTDHGIDGDYYRFSVEASSGASITEIVISYTVSGAAFNEGVAGDGTAMTTIKWSFLQGLSVPVGKATGTILTPIGTQFTSVSCYSGSIAAPAKCTWAAGGTFENPSPTFRDDNRTVDEIITVQFSAPSSQIAFNQVVEELWTLGRAFSTQPLHLLTAIAALVVGGLLVFALQRANGRDVAAVKEPTLVASFVPTGPGTAEFEVAEGFRPGQVGTISDERVDPIDITATILDLAIRGHLRITELPSTSPHDPLDWTFERLEGRDSLLTYERTLLDAVAPVSGESVLVSTIGHSIAPVIGRVQSELYDNVVANGWFVTRPDTTRNRWAMTGWTVFACAVGALAALVALTKFGLLGLALVVIAGLLLVVAQSMPRRTAAGSAVLAGLNVLAQTLATQPLDFIAKDKAYEEISEVLPFAVILGSCGTWTKALADADDDPDVPDPEDLSWYNAPGDWSLSDLPAAFDAFVTSIQGRLYSHG